MPCVLCVNQFQQRQFMLVRFCSQMRRIDSGAVDSCQFALPGQRQWFDGADPLLAVFYWLIPDFFLSQSSSIFSRPISEYSRSGLAEGSAGFGPRLVSNRLDACACSSFFHMPTCVGCTPYSWPISFTVLMPRIASRATLALNSPVKFLRFVSLITCSFLQQATILIYCLIIGVHYNLCCTQCRSGPWLDSLGPQFL